jgi:hypothetical protein
MPGVWLETG